MLSHTVTKKRLYKLGSLFKQVLFNAFKIFFFWEKNPYLLSSLGAWLISKLTYFLKDAADNSQQNYRILSCTLIEWHIILHTHRMTHQRYLNERSAENRFTNWTTELSSPFLSYSKTGLQKILNNTKISKRCHKKDYPTAKSTNHSFQKQNGNFSTTLSQPNYYNFSPSNGSKCTT